MEKLVLLAVLGFLSCAFALPTKEIERVQPSDEDAHLTFLQLCSKYGYKCEQYKIRTDDGYVLTLHRIAQSPKCKITNNKKVAYLQHGLLSSSIDWIIIGPGNALGYLLADCCYDVWLGNFRGNFYSKEHVTLKPDSPEFWDVSWHEIGMYDIPANIDFILQKTKQPKLIHIGHSLGTTTFYILCQFRPDMSSKIYASFQLSPIAYLCHAKSLMLRTFAFNWPILEWWRDVVGLNEFLPTSAFLNTFGGVLCDEKSPYSPLCANSLFMITGYDSEQLNMTQLPIIIGHNPAGASTKQVVHTSQNLASCRFAQFDYGINNWLTYGSLYPPSYKIEKTCAPVYMFMGQNDYISSLQDCEILWNKIPRSYQGGRYIIPYPKFNHLDFLYAMDVKSLVYRELCRQMDQYSGLRCVF